MRWRWWRWSLWYYRRNRRKTIKPKLKDIFRKSTVRRIPVSQEYNLKQNTINERIYIVLFKP
jgi:hypothetical protein